MQNNKHYYIMKYKTINTIKYNEIQNSKHVLLYNKILTVSTFLEGGCSLLRKNISYYISTLYSHSSLLNNIMQFRSVMNMH